ncbi:hypothetical protein OG455_39445 [Kitasatospora sp. NBC_01287]|uniref:hypothetical protein n=1 Tax=Kitasatospora sp. NBC_01287 TaxID=2903573 RepID=UPI00224EEC7D|nr:hypothetical protein [Kitasatospora sp. NBC_01287]MCX4751512.1 hypothetical protein [Kitasatospora sp. NBC_01287]
MDRTTVPLLWFAAPAGFVEVPLGGTAEERLDRLADSFAVLMPDAPLEQRLGSAVNAELLLEAQLSQGLTYLANCLHRTEEGEVTHGVFSIFVTAAQVDGPLTFATRTAQRLAAERPHAEVGVLQLPYADAAVATEDRVVRVPGALYGLTADSESLVRQIEIMIPHPAGRHVVLVVFSTEHPEHWAGWAVVVGAALRNLSHLPPRPAEPERTDLAVAGSAMSGSAVAGSAMAGSAVAGSAMAGSAMAATEDRIRRAFG